MKTPKRNIIYINLQLRSRAVPAQEAPNLASFPDFVLLNIKYMFNFLEMSGNR